MNFFELLTLILINWINLSPQAKSIMSLTWSNINPKTLIKLVAIQLGMLVEAHAYDACLAYRNLLPSWVRAGWEVPHDQYHSMMSHKSHMCYTVSGRVSNVPPLTLLGKGGSSIWLLLREFCWENKKKLTNPSPTVCLKASIQEAGI